jgi:hypothetical protein
LTSKTEAKDIAKRFYSYPELFSLSDEQKTKLSDARGHSLGCWFEKTYEVARENLWRMAQAALVRKIRRAAASEKRAKLNCCFDSDNRILDHVIPLSEGGVHSYDNVQRCGKLKECVDCGITVAEHPWRSSARRECICGKFKNVSCQHIDTVPSPISEKWLSEQQKKQRDAKTSTLCLDLCTPDGCGCDDGCKCACNRVDA